MYFWINLDFRLSGLRCALEVGGKRGGAGAGEGARGARPVQGAGGESRALVGSGIPPPRASGGFARRARARVQPAPASQPGARRRRQAKAAARAATPLPDERHRMRQIQVVLGIFLLRHFVPRSAVSLISRLAVGKHDWGVSFRVAG